jgi:hypothetical protein
MSKDNNMFLKPTPQLLQHIKDSGKPIIQITMEEFQKMASQSGKLLTHTEVMEKLEKRGNKQK